MIRNPDDWAQSVENLLRSGSTQIAARAIFDMTHDEGVNVEGTPYLPLWIDLAIFLLSVRNPTQYTPATVAWLRSLMDQCNQSDWWVE